MQTEKLTIAIDFDDVLGDCNGYAVRITNEKHNLNLTLEDIVSWGELGNDTDKRLECFKEASFFENQPLLPGAKEFIRELLSKPNRDVLIVTAIEPQFMQARAARILSEFPELKPENIIMAARKEKIRADMLLDDNPQNILKSIADYPVLYRRPWNEQLTGMLSVNNYNEFLTLVDRVERNKHSTGFLSREPMVISLVGPSGSGKTSIANELAELPLFAIPRSCTTREKRGNEADTAYYFLSHQKFLEDKRNGRFLETTSYAGENYGMEQEEIERILINGQHAVMPIDICGANAMHSAFGNRAITLFIYRSRKSVIADILSRSTPNEDKLKRIISLDHEYANQGMCDQVILNDKTIKDSAQIIIDMVIPKNTIKNNREI
ncbi:MAG: guanylate kinase [Clostridiales bacterium]|nr:guanylate kinase [Clostridiales bacterium]